jgi:hypothetical protein
MPSVINGRCAPLMPSSLSRRPPAQAARVHRLCEANAFIVKSLTSCVAFGLGSP